MAERGRDEECAGESVIMIENVEIKTIPKNYLNNAIMLVKERLISKEDTSPHRVMKVIKQDEKI